MKLTWNKNPKKRPRVAVTSVTDLPFEKEASETESQRETSDQLNSSEIGVNQSENHLAESFRAQGDKLAEEGKYEEALGKWEAALNLVPENAVLHEQKAQVLLELGEAWKALKAATRATEIDPSWAEAWTTLGRAQLNFGEPDSAIKSFESALSINVSSMKKVKFFSSSISLIQ
ncbi:hypothetical protein AALP_AA2G213700 [Arabis alpina]|uniref:Uncharacterized protein n=1 Tax=Arabis alpina TaxID=50452 RepID=A0A087HJ19_ARAAL|nr:hypothetical protein AALP_AA2G213700 [Arabis alpina]